MVKYSIYPTLLDNFYWAKAMGKWQELLDKINRVPMPGGWPEPVLKGMAFEDLVNKMLDKIPKKPELGFYNHNNFSFDEWLVDACVTKLQSCTAKQKYIEGIVPTKFGNVKMYGFVDFEYPEFYVDLKTGAKYKAGKYAINTQHKCYPIIGGKKHLTYMATDFNNIFYETHQLTPEVKEKFIFDLSEFIEWIEIHRDEITDKKIFCL